MPVSQKGFVDLVQQLAGEVKDARQKLEAEIRKLAELEEKSKELRLKARQMADDSQKVVRLQAQLADRDL